MPGAFNQENTVFVQMYRPGLWDVDFISVTVNNCQVQVWIAEYIETIFLFYF